MASKTGIEWTATVNPDGSVTPGSTWNPTTGCTKVSPGCAHCYAETVALRFWPTQYPPIPLKREEQPVMDSIIGPIRVMSRPRAFTDVLCHEDRLDQPLRWKKPRRIFVNSMSDLFHEDVPTDFIDRVMLTIVRSLFHHFQVLTKRPARMRDYFSDPKLRDRIDRLGLINKPTITPRGKLRPTLIRAWPLPTLWLGVSVETQRFADERIPLLLQTPAAVRFISAEPLLGPVDLSAFVGGNVPGPEDADLGLDTHCIRCGLLWDDGTYHGVHECPRGFGPRLDWVIVGGESGKGSRPFDVAWGRSIVQQCQAAGVPVFVKQLGANVRDRNDAGFLGEEPDAWPDVIDQEDRIERDLDGTRDGYQGAPVRIHLRDRKGSAIEEWPEDLRVRRFPNHPQLAAVSDLRRDGERR